MKQKSVFEFNTYKAIMSYYLAGPKRRGQLTRAADFLNCQRSYLSRVITAELQITPDHAFKLTKFWQLDSEERDYFQNLVEFERAADPSYKAHQKSLLEEKRKRHNSIQDRTKRSSVSLETNTSAYFSSWIWSAVHFLTSIPNYQNVGALMERLGLKKDSAIHFLKGLEAQGYVDHIDGKWKYKSGEFHAPKDSPLVILHHQNWRARALMDAQEFDNQSVHYTGVHTLSQGDVVRLRELLLNFIAEANEIAAPSPPEEAVVLTCDLFRV